MNEVAASQLTTHVGGGGGNARKQTTELLHKVALWHFQMHLASHSSELSITLLRIPVLLRFLFDVGRCAMTLCLAALMSRTGHLDPLMFSLPHRSSDEFLRVRA